MENLVANINREFWKNKRVFITGHTGFKGSWLSLLLQTLGANICGYALAPNTTPNLFTQANVANDMQSIKGDIRDLDKLEKQLLAFRPNIIIHMAAQALVRYSYENPLETYQVNVMGTIHLFEAARKVDSVKAIINVTSDKCYENKEWIWGCRENEPMGGHDPYSNSKACAELITSAYQKSFFLDSGVGLATARAGNVIGGGDWTESRLIPDIIRAFIANENVMLRYPKAIRPWQHVLEPLNGYLILAERLYENPLQFSGAWNFGPDYHDQKDVAWIVDQLSALWGNVKPWMIESNKQPHEAHFLKLDCSKANTLLNWELKWSLGKSLKMIVEWYRAHIENQDMQVLTLNQINTYYQNKAQTLVNNILE